MGDDNRGTKRKRHEPTKEKDPSARIVGKLHHDVKEVRKAAKKAKTFETQKLVKKLKGLRGKKGSEPEIPECESQLEELKKISHDAVAHTALKTKITKDRLLSEHEQMQIAMSQELASNLLEQATPGTPAAKVQSRLLSSKILALEIASVVESFRSLLNPKPDIEEEEDIVPEDLALERPKKVKKLSGVKEDDEDEDGDVRMRIGDEDEEGAEVEEDYEGAAEDVDSEWESGTVGDDEKETGDGWESGSLAGDYGEAGSDAGNMSEDEVDLPKVPSTSKLAKKVPATKSKPAKVVSESTFLPSLSVGFVRGESGDSDWSDGEANAGDIELKKNRRGQRARRAIWEKKFGHNANHKKKEALEIPERGRKRWPDHKDTSHNRPPVGDQGKFAAGRDMKKPGRDSRQQHQEPDSGWNKRSKPTTQASANKDERPLHPSWEAKKKLKEKQSAAILPAVQGRKIKFS